MKNLIVLLFIIPLFGNAQSNHTVAPKESLYSLGRQYKIHPKELADYNKISLETGLTIGQVLRIPPTATIPPPDTRPTPKKTETIIPTATPVEAGSVPVYHKVQKKETLFQISRMHNKVAIADIKKWNNLTGDGVTEGTNLIVGYQDSKKVPAVSEDQGSKKEVTEIPGKPVIEEIKPVISQPAEPVKKESVQIIKKAEPLKVEANKNLAGSVGGGFFKNLFITQTEGKTELKEESGMAATFKSTSGWQDGKYYCLYNNAPSGTIVRITNKSTQKSVYAKVLDIIPDLKQNVGILIRLGNAAVDELGGGTDNFEAVINF